MQHVKVMLSAIYAQRTAAWFRQAYTPAGVFCAGYFAVRRRAGTEARSDERRQAGQSNTAKKSAACTHAQGLHAGATQT